MKLLKGKKIADKIIAGLKKAIKKQKSQPALAVILAGENKASEIYVRLKKQAARKVGIAFFLYKFSKNSGEKEIIGKIKKLNRDKKISGILVQLPLPKNLNTQKIIKAVSHEKDVDGFSPKNIQKYLRGGKVPTPVFPHAIVLLIESSNQKLRNKQAIVIANSKMFGETMLAALRRENIKGGYILYKNLKRNFFQIDRADIVITAIGKPKLIKGNMVKEGAIVIDGGITKIGKKVAGDVDFKSVKNKASCVSPVPGGVGPVTIACLLENVYLLNKKSR